MRKYTRRIKLALLGGTLLFFGGCLGSGAKQILLSTALYLGQEYVFDGGIFDLFPNQSTNQGG